MKILITAGGTREYIDPVRFISNASTGKMGYALARAAVKAGHSVTLITAPTALRKPTNTNIIEVQTSAEMFKAVKQLFPESDCLIMSAAVSDYKPAKTSASKIKKSQQDLTIKLKATQDILKWAGRNKQQKQFIAGFALEDKSLKENAEEKMHRKNLDMIVANTPTAIASEKSTVYIKTKNADWIELKNKKKSKTAEKIIDIIDKASSQ